MAAEEDQYLIWSRILVDKVLSILLSTEELSNPTLRVLLNDIFAGMIVYNGVCLKVSEPWFVWDTISKVIYVLRHQSSQPRLKRAESDSQGLKPSQAETRIVADQPALIGGIVQQVKSIRLMMLHTWGFFTTWLATLMSAFSDEASHDGKEARSTSSSTTAGQARNCSVATARIWTLLVFVLQLQQRMPWLTGLLSLLQWLILYGPTKVCEAGSTLDR